MPSLFLQRTSAIPVNLFIASTIHGPQWSESASVLGLLLPHIKINSRGMTYSSANGKILKLLGEDKGLYLHKYEVVSFEVAVMKDQGTLLSNSTVEYTLSKVCNYVD